MSVYSIFMCASNSSCLCKKNLVLQPVPGQGVPVPLQSELPSRVLFCLVALAQKRGSVSSEVVLGGFFLAHNLSNSEKLHFVIRNWFGVYFANPVGHIKIEAVPGAGVPVSVLTSSSPQCRGHRRMWRVAGGWDRQQPIPHTLALLIYP